jgi:hypothetical protein
VWAQASTLPSASAILEPAFGAGSEFVLTTDIDPAATSGGSRCASERNHGWWFPRGAARLAGTSDFLTTHLPVTAPTTLDDSAHPVITSFVPVEDSFYDDRTTRLISGPELAGPHHPSDRTTHAGPAGRVPRGWQHHLNT